MILRLSATKADSWHICPHLTIFCEARCDHSISCRVIVAYSNHRWPGLKRLMTSQKQTRKAKTQKEVIFYSCCILCLFFSTGWDTKQLSPRSGWRIVGVSFRGNFFFHSSRVQKSEIKVPAGLLPSRNSWEDSAPCPSPSSWWMPATLAFLHLSLHHSRLRCTCPPLCVCDAKSPLTTLVTGFGAHSDSLWPSYLITSAKTLIPNQVTLWGPRWIWICGGHYSIHYRWHNNILER